jgi:hypothetical protein
MIIRKFVLAALVLIAGVCCEEEGASKEVPTVVQGISVPILEKTDQDVAQDRVDFQGDGEEDQIALESNIAEERDGDGGHGHGHGHEQHGHDQHAHVVHAPDNFALESAQFDTYSAPPQQFGNSPAQQQYGGPPPAPNGDSYGSPKAPVQNDDGYGAPQAPVVDSYGAPQAPIVDSYGSPQAPIKTDGYGAPQAPIQNYGPIPVPVSVHVRPQSLVLPQGPHQSPNQGYGPPPPPKQNSYRPPPPKQNSYRPPPPKRPPPKQNNYRGPPPKKPQYKPQPKPQYNARPPPPKQQYKPRPPPPKPQYQPQRPSKPQYQPPPPPKPQYKPAPSQPKPQYKPAPVPAPAPSYSPKPVSRPAPHTPSGGDPWPQAQPDMPKITSLDVTCEKNLMKVYIEFDKPFYGIIFSKGHYSDVNCVHLPAGLGRTNAKYDVSINSCGTTGNTENGLYGYGADSGSGTYFENTIVIQYDPQVQEVWDQARKLRCTWHDQYEKSVTFRPFPVDMLDVVRADFAGDNVGCWMQIQVGKGPWASEVSGLVKIGQTMTMVLAIKDDEQKFDMMVRNCMAHDGKRAPIQLVDQKGCVTRPKLMSRFTKIKNFGASASVLSYAHFQAFKFPDSMEVHFQCTIQICRYQCPDQCDSGSQTIGTDNPQAPTKEQDSYGSPQSPVKDSYGSPQAAPQSYGRTRREAGTETIEIDLEDVGVQKVIQVVSSGDLTFAIKENDNDTTLSLYPPVTQSWSAGEEGYICMSTPAFAATLVILLAILVISCLLSAFLCLRHRSYYGESSLIAAFANPVFSHKKGHF